MGITGSAPGPSKRALLRCTAGGNEGGGGSRFDSGAANTAGVTSGWGLGGGSLPSVTARGAGATTGRRGTGAGRGRAKASGRTERSVGGGATGGMEGKGRAGGRDEDAAIGAGRF